jgi:hypothetical protein
MTENVSTILGPWSSFCILTGSAAASLTGLMFVVITLIMNVERLRRTRDGISTFSTPTVVHFGAVLFVSGVLSAPWHALAQPATLLGLMGLAGVVYILRITYRANRLRLSSYEPDLEDIAFYTILPFIAYGVILAAATMLYSAQANALFAIGGAITLLIFVGIHNAWDIVTFIATEGFSDQPPPKD